MIFIFLFIRLGRKRAAYIFIILNAIINISIAIITNITAINVNTKQVLYGILRFLSGIASNVYSVAVVLGIL